MINYKSKVALVLASACILTTLSSAKSFKAETIAESKKTAILKTSIIKMDDITIAEGLQIQDEEESHSVSRGMSSISSSIMNLAYEQIGAPYVWGATGPTAFDCSGFTSYVFEQMGINLPRTSSSQYYAGYNISKDELQPGDLVFFNTYGTLSHVGIYIGGGEFIHAATTSVVISSLYEEYYSSTYAGATRVL